MAALLKSKLGVQAHLIEGDRGEWTVWVGDEKVAAKGWILFPSDGSVVEAVKNALA